MIMIWFNKPHDLMHFTPAYAFLVSPSEILPRLDLNWNLDLSYGLFYAAKVSVL